MNSYTVDLSKCKPGDIVAFDVCQPRIISRGEFYINDFWQIDRMAEQSCKPYRCLTPIDPRRLTLDGEPCVRERFKVRRAVNLVSYYVYDSETNGGVAEFYNEADARSYAAWRNRSET